MTRSQVEKAFRAIAGTATVFEPAGAIKRVPRVLGHDSELYTAIEINGYPEVVDVQVVTVLDLRNKRRLERQFMYDSLSCGELGGRAAQVWCLGHALHTNKTGLVNARSTKVFGRLRFTVRTFNEASSGAPQLVQIDISGR